MSNEDKTMIICRKITLTPLGDKAEVDRVYKFIRDGQKAQYKALNLFMSKYANLYYKYNCDKTNEDYKKEVKEMRRAAYYNSLYNSAGIVFCTGVDTQSLVSKKVISDFDTAYNNGLKRGERSINNYKSDSPLMTRHINLKFNYDYATEEEFLQHLNSQDLSITMGWVNHIKFKVNFGKGKNVKKSYELRSVFKKILVDKTYSVRDSSITIEDNKIILNLSLRIPKNIIELDNNTVVGVDLGIAIPAVCATNNTIAKQYLGSKDDFLKTRTQIQNQRRRLYSALKNSNGGKGRDKKLKAVNKFSEKEKNFVATYNHTISKQIVDFAIANKAKYINVEDLEGYDTDKFVLRNWSYYQLQSQIEYKAAKYGIELRKVDPYHTSQNCSSCGHWEEGQRNGRYFECKACGAKMNADLNAARNIALSANITYVDGKKIETNTTDVPKKKLIRKSLRQ